MNLFTEFSKTILIQSRSKYIKILSKNCILDALKQESLNRKPGMRLDSSPLAPRPCLLRQGTRVFQASQAALFWVSAPGSPGFSGHGKSHHAFLPHTEADVSRKSSSVSGLEAQFSVPHVHRVQLKQQLTDEL